MGVRLRVSALENELPLQGEGGGLRPWLRQEVLAGKHGPQRSAWSGEAESQSVMQARRECVSCKPDLRVEGTTVADYITISLLLPFSI